MFLSKKHVVEKGQFLDYSFVIDALLATWRRERHSFLYFILEHQFCLFFFGFAGVFLFGLAVCGGAFGACGC